MSQQHEDLELASDTVYSALVLAQQFHDIYERLAPSFGYETRPETRTFAADSPNGRLMVAVCEEIIARNENGKEIDHGRQ